MDQSGAIEGHASGRRPPTPSTSTPTAAKKQAAQTGPMHKVKITPFHSSPIVSGGGSPCSKKTEAASGSGMLLAAPGRQTASTLREKHTDATYAAASSQEQTSSSVSSKTPVGEKAQASPHVVLVKYVRFHTAT